MEHIILKGTAGLPFVHISVVELEGPPCWSCLFWKAVVPKLSCLLPTWSHSNPISVWLLTLGSLSAISDPASPLWMWCFFLVYLALTLGFHSRTLAWHWTGSSWEHSEYNDSLRISFPGSNELDQPQVGLIGQRIQLMQKSIERWEYSLRLCEKFEHMQNHYLNSLQLLLGKNRIFKSK